MPASEKRKGFQQKSNVMLLQTPRETVATARKGFKRPSPELAELLRLANLVSSSVKLPHLNWMFDAEPHNLQRALAPLPEAIRLELLEDNAVWPLPRKYTDEPIIVQWLVDCAQGPESKRCLIATLRYQTILDARENLRRIVDRTPEPLRLKIHAIRGPNGKLELQKDDWTIQALLSAELDYLSRCAYSKCDKFFYAVRRGQPGCNPAHSDIIRKQRKRERDKANRELNETRKKKRAKTAR